LFISDNGQNRECKSEGLENGNIVVSNGYGLGKAETRAQMHALMRRNLARSEPKLLYPMPVSKTENRKKKQTAT
jgi:hypothetical protein